MFHHADWCNDPMLLHDGTTRVRLHVGAHGIPVGYGHGQSNQITAIDRNMTFDIPGKRTKILAGKSLPKTIDDLTHLDWIKLRQLPVNRQLISTNGEMPRVTPNISIEVDGVVALCQMAKSGMGIASVPTMIAKDDLESGQLIALNPNWTLMPIALYAVWPNNVSEESLTLRFVRFLADKMAISHS